MALLQLKGLSGSSGGGPGFAGAQVVISTASDVSLGNGGIRLSGLGSQAWNTANMAIYVPFRLTSAYSMTSLFILNGGTISGNVDLGIYDATGTKVSSTGSTAHAGANAAQAVALSLTLASGLYYFALAMSSATATIQAGTAMTIAMEQCVGMAQETSAFPLPATATFATIANAFIPLIGATARSFV